MMRENRNTRVVVSAQPSRLNQVLEAANEAGASFVFIDSAPHSESSALTAARAADIVLIPCRPAILDIRAISNTIDLVNLSGTKAAVILNCVPPRGTLQMRPRKLLPHMAFHFAR